MRCDNFVSQVDSKINFEMKMRYKRATLSCDSIPSPRNDTQVCGLNSHNVKYGNGTIFRGMSTRMYRDLSTLLNEHTKNLRSFVEQ